jgi:hypothetical protein
VAAGLLAVGAAGVLVAYAALGGVGDGGSGSPGAGHGQPVWDLTAEIEAPGRMTTHGAWQGTFRLIDGERVAGEGTIRTTVTGSCVSGVSTAPLTISGHREQDILRVRLMGDPHAPEAEPDLEQEESMECAVRTLTELPAFFEGLASLARRFLEAERACPLEVPMDAASTTVECAGVTFRVVRRGE